MRQKVNFWSDAAISASGSTASACIIELACKSFKVCCILPDLDISTAELSGLAVGGSLLKLCLATEPFDSHWVCDNRSLVSMLNSGKQLKTENVNFTQATFRTFSNRTLEWLRANGSFVAEFSSRSSMKPRHLACDRASRWISKKGQALLSRFGEGFIPSHQQRHSSGPAWLLLDLSEENSLRALENTLETKLLEFYM